MLASLRQWLRDLFGLVPVLDLHGLGVKDARRECDDFLAQARAQGVSCVRIVYGKGKRSPGGIGVLRQAVPSWLDHHPSVARYQRQLDASGDDGSVRVWLESDDEA